MQRRVYPRGIQFLIQPQSKNLCRITFGLGVGRRTSHQTPRNNILAIQNDVPAIDLAPKVIQREPIQDTKPVLAAAFLAVGGLHDVGLLPVEEERALVAGLRPGLVDGVKGVDDAVRRRVDERVDRGVVSPQDAEVELRDVVHVARRPLGQAGFSSC